MNLQGVLFLAALTSRSKAYAQALVERGLRPGRTLLFGPRGAGAAGQIDRPPETPRRWEGIVFLPDLSEDLRTTVVGAAWPFEEIEAATVNDPAIAARIKAIDPELVVYSGFGGQIVGASLLGRQFLHLHAGRLPDYRGSTTLYYSWIREGCCHVSAIILKERIDEGPVVAMRRYPPPPDGVDPDHVYDPAIRADLLASVLEEYGRTGLLPEEPQSGAGTTYYVIHPVLKHLARLRRS